MSLSTKLEKKRAAALRVVASLEAIDINALIAQARPAPVSPLLPFHPSNFIPSNTIAILNIGQGQSGSKPSSADPTELSNVFSHGKLILGLGKPYGFVKFNTVEDAVEVMNRVDSVPCEGLSNKKILLLAYIRSVPGETGSREEEAGGDVVRPEMDKVTAAVPGLDVMLNFVSEEEEKVLVKFVDDTEDAWNHLRDRRVQHYGYIFDYSNHGAIMTRPFPPWTESLLSRFNHHRPQTHSFNQLTINEYPPGTGIAPHVDAHTTFHSPILIISLSSDIVMEFAREGKSTQHLLLPRRSALLMKAESRWSWTHGIRARKLDGVAGRILTRGRRISLTFRRVRLVNEEDGRMFVFYWNVENLRSGKV
ncbi:hypothetical protein BJ742DRAFT_736802 [Cladochytrium replicatum]|nr:hypothetical protein BJ742DRAFT_736802 [Cladochytrium replicatum]